jgi:hypothetical protein
MARCRCLLPISISASSREMLQRPLTIFGSEINETTRRVTAATESVMRCQVALTVIAYRAGIDIDTLLAPP